MRSKPSRWKLLLISSIAGGGVPTTLFLLKVYQIVSETTQYLVMAAGSLTMSAVCAGCAVVYWRRADWRWGCLAVASIFATLGVTSLISLTGEGTFENTLRDRSLQVSAIVLFLTSIILAVTASVVRSNQGDGQGQELAGEDQHSV